ncbi:hypothetical protein FRC01_009514 [Tulasnella sp. 417]|nr:hypothetical protein FRC01_009514 [Tulasnella sp. 417]
MFALSPRPPASTPNSGAFAFKDKDVYIIGDNGTKPNEWYWSGLDLSRQRVRYRVTLVPDLDNLKAPKLKYGAITAMPEFLNTSFDELRLTHYFDGLVHPKRSWENPAPLSIPLPPPSQPISVSTAVFPTIPPSSTPTATQATSTLVANDQTPTNATELVSPVQAFAALGLNSQPSTPAANPLRGVPDRPTQPGLLSFRKYNPRSNHTVSYVNVDYYISRKARSPAAEQIPVVNIAETEWEAARHAVAWRKELLEKAQAEYDEAVRAEIQKFKAYSEARANFDK